MKKLLSFTALGVVSSLVLYAPAMAKPQKSHLELSTVIEQVYRSNPTLMAAREELKEVWENYPQARAGWRPTIAGEASIYTTDIENNNFSSGTGATTKDLTLSLDQPIWRGGQTFAETDQARDLIRAGKAVLKQAEQDIFLQTATAYMNILRDKELLELYQNNENILLQELRATWERMDIGDITKTDVEQAKTRLSRAKSERILAERNLEISKASFEEISGIVATEKLSVPYIRLPVPEKMEELISLAEQQNPEILSAEHQHYAAEHNADATFRELLPQVSAFASINKQYDPQPGIIEKSQTETIGLRATLALYEGGATRSRIREARYAAKREEYQTQETRRRIRQEVISNWRSYQAAKAQSENKKEEIESAQNALAGVREEARLGQRSVIDILDADEEVIDAKVGLARARRNEIVTRFALANSLGVLTIQNLLER